MPPIVGSPLLVYVFLIAEAADRISVALAVVVPEHVRVAVVQAAAVGVVAVALRRGPDAGVVARAVEPRTVADACRNGGKARRVVRRQVVAYRAIGRVVSVPPLCGGQRLGDVIAVAAALEFTLAAHIVGQRCPLRIARQMPACRTDAPAGADECHGHRVVVAGVHARLPVGRVERVHRRVPVVQQTVVHRRIRGGVVVVPAGLLARVGVIGIGGRDKVRPRARRGGGPQVVAHPALVADLHRGILIALMVGHRLGTGAGLFVNDGRTPAAATASFIAEAADRIPAVLVADGPVHVHVVAVQDAVVGVVAVALRRGPEVGDVARGAERRTVAVACRNGGKARRVVRRQVVAYRAIGRVNVPPLCGGQRLGDVAAVAAASVFALATDIIRQLRPLRIARQVPTRRTDAPAGAGECHGDRVAGAGVHAGLPVGRVERVHRRVPVVEQAVVHRRIRCRVVVVPAGLLACVRVISIGGRDKVGSRARRGGGPQVVAHPALVADLHRGILVALMVGHRLGTGTGLFVNDGGAAGRKGRECHFLAIRRTRAVRGIRSHIVGGIGGKSRDIAGEAAHAAAVGGVAVIYRWVLRSTPTHAAGDHARAAIGRDVAAYHSGS